MKLCNGLRQTTRKPRSSFSAPKAESICQKAGAPARGRGGGEGVIKIAS